MLMSIHVITSTQQTNSFSNYNPILLTIIIVVYFFLYFLPNILISSNAHISTLSPLKQIKMSIEANEYFAPNFTQSFSYVEIYTNEAHYYNQKRH